jgi:Fur family ferric uptake transcriptional regulator
MHHKHEKGVEIKLEEVLHTKGFRVTNGRLKLLAFLAHAGRPLSIQQILALWKGKSPDMVTLYRSLSDLSRAGIVQRIDLNTGVAHFEYTPNRPHHHHIVCSDCGAIEEIEVCAIDTLQKKIMHKSKQFKDITTHNLEFFGHCIKCAHI